MSIKSFDDLNLENIAAKVCKEEIEVANQLIDLTLDYQDDGAKFRFKIYYSNLENSSAYKYPIYYTNKNSKLIFNVIYKHIFNNNFKTKYKIESEIIVSSLNDIGYERELEKSIVSHFSSDWRITVSRNGFGQADFILSKISYHEISNYLGRE